MENSNDYLFGPLDNKYCLYFYYLSVFGYAFFVLTAIYLLYFLIVTKKTEVFYFSIIYKLFLSSLIYGVFYFQNRILYSMCIKSI